MSIRSVPSLVAMYLLAACSAGDARPREWPAPRLANGDACPLLIGRYLAENAPVPFHLALRHAPAQRGEAAPVSFAIADQADSTLSITVRYTDGDDAAVTLRRGGEWSGDYYCSDGWLRLRLDGGPSRWDSLARPGGHSAKRRTLRIAPTAEGALIARLDAHWFEGFQPYSPGSGDGIPLPWTWKRAHVWLRTEPFSEAALARLSAREAGTAEEPATTDGWQQDPVYLANQALENPPPTAGLEAAEARIRQAAPRGMHMLVVVPRDSGWHVSVAVQDDAQLMLFLSNLGQQEDVEQVQHDVLVRGRTSDGAMSTAVYVRFASRMRMTPER